MIYESLLGVDSPIRAFLGEYEEGLLLGGHSPGPLAFSNHVYLWEGVLEKQAFPECAE